MLINTGLLISTIWAWFWLLTSGMATHEEITHQARFIYKDDPNAFNRIHESYLQAGSYFPDWGYSCGSSANEAEMAHWPDFWNATLAHLSKKYSRPWNLDAERLVSFLFGVISHSIADVSWHSLYMNEGFIDAMRFLDFGGNYDNAHMAADFGGDFLISRFSKQKYLDYWSVPTLDIVEIYAAMGRKVDKFTLNSCMAVGFAVLQANRMAGKFAFPIIAHQSPFLVQNYFSYFKGGVISMALAVSECWKSFDEWERTGNIRECAFMGTYYRRNTSTTTTSLLEACATMKGIYAQTTGVSITNIRSTTMLKLQTGYCVAKSIFGGKSGNRLYQTGIFASLINTGLAAWNELKSLFKKRCRVPVGPTIYTTEEYSGFGKALARGDFNGDGFMDLAVGAPTFSANGKGHIGKVAVLYGPLNLKDKSYNINSLNSGTLYGNNVTGSMFGSAIVALDFNCDGLEDLAISSPHDGEGQYQKSGVVYIIFGQKGRQWNLNKFDVVINGFLNPKGEIERIGGLGTVLSAGDLDGDLCQDLLVGSPMLSASTKSSQSGMVHVFLSKSGHRGTIGVDIADYNLSPRIKYEHFGSSISMGRNTILIGAPSTNGKLYEISLRDLQKPNYSSFLISDQDSTSFSSQTLIINDTLVVSSPFETSKEATRIPANMPGILLDNQMQGYQAGGVRFFRDRERSPFITLTGFASLGHFGSQLSTIGNFVAIAEPLVYAG